MNNLKPKTQSVQYTFLLGANEDPRLDSKNGRTDKKGTYFCHVLHLYTLVGSCGVDRGAD